MIGRVANGENDDNRSVRVEFDAPDGNAELAPEVASSSRRQPLLVAGLALLAIVSVALLFRPGAGGEGAATPTSAPEAASALDADADEVEVRDAFAVPLSVFGANRGPSQEFAESNGTLLSVVRSNTVGEGLLWARSVDGITWETFSPVIDGPATEIPGDGVIERESAYTNLIGTPQGFAVLMWTFQESLDDRSHTTLLHRLESVDGIEWSPTTSDPLRTYVDSGWGWGADVHGEDLIALSTWEPSPLGGELLLNVLADPTAVPAAVCDIRWTARRIIVETCDDEPATIFDAESLAEPDAFRDVWRCGDALAQHAGSVTYDVIDVATGRSVPVDTAGRRIADVAVGSGAVAFVEAAWPGDNSVSECAGLVDVPITEPGVIVVSVAAGEQRSVPVPRDLRTAPALAQLDVIDDEVLFWADGKLHRLDPRLDEWTAVLTRSDLTGQARPVFSSDGRLMAVVDRDRVHLATIEAGEWIDLRLRDGVAVGQPVLVSDSVVIADRAGEHVAIPLDGSGEELTPVGVRIEGLDVPFVSNVVAADLGYLTLEPGFVDDVAPRLRRSIDGITWTAVEADVPEADPTAESVRYSDLLDLDGEFAMVRTMVLPPSAGSSERSVVAHRLISSSGRTWTLDDPAPLFEAAGQTIDVVLHEPSTVAFVADEGIAGLKNLFDHALDVELGFGPCGAVRVEEGLDIEGCGGETRRVDANELADGTELADVAECARSYETQRMAPMTVVVASTSTRQIVNHDLSAVDALQFAIDDEGALLAIDIGRPASLPASCSGLIETEPIAPSIVRFAEDGPERILSFGLAPTRQPSPIWATDDGVGVWTDDGLVAVGADGVERQLIRPPADAERGLIGQQFSPDGTSVALLAARTIWIGDIESETWRSVPLLIDMGSMFLTHFDGQSAAASNGTSAFWLDLREP